MAVIIQKVLMNIHTIYFFRFKVENESGKKGLLD